MTLDDRRDAAAMLRAALANDTEAWNTLIDHCELIPTLTAVAEAFLVIARASLCDRCIDAWLARWQDRLSAGDGGPPR